MPKEHKMMQVTNRIDNLSYLQNNSIKAERKAPPPDLGNNREKIGFGTGLLAYLTGGLTYTVLQKAYNQTIYKNIIKQLTKTAKSEKGIGEVLDKTLEKSGLAAKGIQIEDVANMFDLKIYTPNGERFFKSVNDQIGELFITEFEMNPVTKPFFKKLFKNGYLRVNIQKQVGGLIGPTFKNGKNAIFMPSSKKILLNTEKIGYAGFHEIGHAMNRHLSKTGKILQNMQATKLLAPVLLMTALLTNKRNADNPPQTKWQKTKNFIKENIGKLAALSCVPMLAEEIMASVKGQKLAKSILPKGIMKNVTKTHLISAASYLGLMFITGIGAYAANKIRDLVAHKKVA